MNLDEAHRWLNLAVQRLGAGGVPGTDHLALDLILVTIVRRRIRRALGPPADAADRVADRLVGRAAPRGQGGRSTGRDLGMGGPEPHLGDAL